MKLKHIILLIALSLSYSGHILAQTVYVTNQQQFKEYADRTESACTPNLTIAVEGSIKNLNDVKLCDNLTIEGMPYTDAVLSAKGSFRPVTLLEVGRNDTIKNITLNLQSDEDDIALTNNSLLNGFGSLKVNHVVDENGLMKFSVSQQQQQPSTLFFKDNTINLGMQPVSSIFVAALEVDAYTKKILILNNFQ